MYTAVKETRSGTWKLLTGNNSAAYGAKLARVEVISAYPITPQTTIIEYLSQFVASGELKARFVKAESEHSALSVLAGASATGVRTFTATSRQGLLLMHEVLHWTGRGRVPIVMAVVNGGIGAPGHYGLEQDDSFSQRDTGWLQFYCESNQEVLDTVIQAYRVAEQVSLPVMVVYDGVLMSHTSEPVLIPDIKVVDEYLPRRETRFRLNLDEPMAFFEGPPVRGGAEYMSGLRRETQEAMEIAKEVTKKADQEFRQYFGRSYGVLDCYQTEDADVVLVAVTSVATIAHGVVDDLRAQGKKVGLLRVRMLRPFPKQEIAAALSGAKKVAVIDRNISYGRSGVLAMEIKAALYDEQKKPPVFGFITGISGANVSPMLVHEIADYAYLHERPATEIIWVGVPQFIRRG